MLLQVSNVVTVNPVADGNNSIVVRDANAEVGPATAGLWVTSLTSSAPVPQMQGQSFAQITGELHFITGHWRLQPRTPADLTPVLPDAG